MSRYYAIHQLVSRVNYRFMGWDYAIEIDKSTNKPRFSWNDYQEIAGGIFDDDSKTDTQVLDDLFYKYNMNIPHSYKGHSMSVSDIVELKEGSRSKYYYVDSIGFKDISDIVLNS